MNTLRLNQDINLLSVELSSLYKAPVSDPSQDLASTLDPYLVSYSTPTPDKESAPANLGSNSFS